MEANYPPLNETPASNWPRKKELERPCRITNVHIKGAHRTRPTLIAKIVGDIFQTKTMDDFVLRSIQVRENLKTLNAFSSIEVKAKPADNNDDDSYEVTFVLQEHGRLRTSAQTAIDSHSTHINMQLTLPNISGIGDSLQLNTKYNKRFYSGESRFSVPLIPWRQLWAPTYSLSYSQYQWDGLTSGIDQEDKAIINQIDFYSLPQLQHSISFENIWRYIKSSSLKTPIEIREQCGHSVKSSIKHTLTWDNRLGGNFPYEGILAKLSNEFTTNLVSNSARFTRHEANFQFNTLLLPKYDLICQVNVLAGTLVRPYKVNICDKFFAGGQLTLRGFQFQGLEPNIRGHPLGDASYLSAGVHLYSTLPYTKPDSPIHEYIRPHIFINTGTIGDIQNLWRISSKEDIRREAFRFRDSLRYSCGFGMVMQFMRFRLEINYCLPLVFKPNDLSARGIQWGFGLTYT